MIRKKNTLLLPVCLFLIPAICTSCHQHTADDHHHGETQKEPDRHQEVYLTDEQIAAVGIVTGNVEQKNLMYNQKVNGFLKVPNHNKAIATSVYSGVINTLLVQPGAHVKKGQVIATITSPALVETQQKYIAVREQLRLAEKELVRQKELVTGNASPLKMQQQAEAQWQTVNASHESMKQQLQLMGVKAGIITPTIAIRSPITGSVSTVQAQIGSPVDVNTPIAEIVNNEVLHLDVLVYEQDLSKVKKGQTIDFVLTNYPDGHTYQAKVFSIGTAFENETRSIPVHAQVTGLKTGLIEGMSVTAMLNLDNATVDAVPSEAIVTYRGLDFIFIEKTSRSEKEGHAQDEAGISFERIPVKKGITDLGYTAITPLKETHHARVVTKGAFFLLAKMTNSGEAHNH